MATVKQAAMAALAVALMPSLAYGAALGNDRFGKALKRGRPQLPKTMGELVPATLIDLEKLLGIGASCARADSNEVFAIEDRRTRSAAAARNVDQVVPRFVIAGCASEAGRQGADGLRKSFELLSLVKTEEGERKTIEAMALDEDLGIFNFYDLVYDKAGPAELRRFVQESDGSTTMITLKQGQGKNAVLAETTTKPPSKMCFGCHLNAGPIMNPLRPPWTGWISPRRPASAVRLREGDRQHLLQAAVLDAAKGKSGFANDLEVILKAGLHAYVAGDGQQKGLLARRLAAPGGLKQALRSVFCQTEVGFAAGTDRLQLELLADPEAATLPAALADRDAFGAFAEEREKLFADPPRTFGTGAPNIAPVRSEIDRAIEQQLIAKGWLSWRVALAIRLLDDAKDVFSSKRCETLDGLSAELLTTKVPATFLTGLKAKLLERVGALRLALPTATYATQLLGDAPLGLPAQTAYHKALAARVESAPLNKEAVKAEIISRRQAAYALYTSADGGPIPRLALPADKGGPTGFETGAQAPLSAVRAPELVAYGPGKGGTTRLAIAVDPRTATLVHTKLGKKQPASGKVQGVACSAFTVAQVDRVKNILIAFVTATPLACPQAQFKGKRAVEVQ